ncbi:MAG: DUF2793 domain-containing protein, partial [Candidatus Odinarchaeia archaeon]
MTSYDNSNDIANSGTVIATGDKILYTHVLTPVQKIQGEDALGINPALLSINDTIVITNSRVLQDVTADTSIITSGTFADARISETSVTQHQTALSIATTQLKGDMPDARIVVTNVTQHVASIDHDSLLNFSADEHFTQANITTVGIISTGTWQADVIDQTYLDTDLVLKDGSRAFTGTVAGVTPTSGSHLATKSYVDSIAQGLEWQDSVLDRYDPNGGLPGTPSTGDRYISTATANGWTDEYIYEYNGSSWDETVPNEGYACWVEDEDVLYVYNGSNNWVKFGATIDHDNLINVGTNTHTQIDSHISGTGADHSYIDQDVTSGSAPTFTADNFSDGGTNAIITTTQETNFESAYTHATGNGSDHSDVALNTTHRTSNGSDHSFIDQDV